MENAEATIPQETQKDQVLTQINQARNTGIAEIGQVNPETLDEIINSALPLEQKLRKWCASTLTNQQVWLHESGTFIQISSKFAAAKEGLTERQGENSLDFLVKIPAESWENRRTQLENTGYDLVEGKTNKWGSREYSLSKKGDLADKTRLSLNVQRGGQMFSIGPTDFKIPPDGNYLELLAALMGQETETLRNKVETAVTKKFIDEKPRIAEKFRKVQEFFNDPLVLEAIKDDTNRAVEVILERLPEERKQYCINILKESARKLPLVLVEESSSEPLEEIKKFYTSVYKDFLFSRAADMDTGNRITETELESVSQNNYHNLIFGCIIDPDQGENYIRDNRIYFHYGDRVALQAKFYKGDVDHPDSPVRSAKDYLSYPDAKIYYSFNPGMREGRTDESPVINLSDIVEVAVDSEQTREAVSSVFPPERIKPVKFNRSS